MPDLHLSVGRSRNRVSVPHGPVSLLVSVCNPHQSGGRPIKCHISLVTFRDPPFFQMSGLDCGLWMSGFKINWSCGVNGGKQFRLPYVETWNFSFRIHILHRFILHIIHIGSAACIAWCSVVCSFVQGKSTLCTNVAEIRWVAERRWTHASGSQKKREWFRRELFRFLPLVVSALNWVSEVIHQVEAIVIEHQNLLQPMLPLARWLTL